MKTPDNEVIGKARKAGLNTKDAEDFLLHMQDTGITDFDKCMNSWRQFQSTPEITGVTRITYIIAFMALSGFVLFFVPPFFSNIFGLDASISRTIGIISALVLTITGFSRGLS